MREPAAHSAIQQPHKVNSLIGFGLQDTWLTSAESIFEYFVLCPKTGLSPPLIHNIGRVYDLPLLEGLQERVSALP